MEFWESFFIILGSVIAGLIISLAIIYGIAKLQKKPFILSGKSNHATKDNALVEPEAMLTAVKTKLAEQEQDKLEESAGSLKEEDNVSETPQIKKSDIFKELEANLEIAITPWSGKLTLFQTTFWDSDNIKTDSNLLEFHEDITQVYIDIRLANSIVWLSNEVGHRSEDLDESYKQLCIKIAERLKKIIPSLEKIK